MRFYRGTLVLALSLAATPASSAVAQSDFERERLYTPPAGPARLDLTLGYGTSFSSDWSEQIVLETRDLVGNRTTRLLLPEVAMAPGRTFGGAVGYWRDYLGVRLHAAFTDACLTAGRSRCDGETRPETPGELATELEVWTYGLQAVVGLTRGALARAVRPYLLVGAAGVTLDPDEPVPPSDFPDGDRVAVSGSGDVIVLGGTTDLVLTLDRLGFETRLAAEFGAGLDLRLPLGPHGIGLRLELVDQIMSSPIGVGITRLDGGFSDDDFAVELRRPLVHTLRATVGAVVDMGLPTPPPRPVAAYAPR